MIEGLSKFLYVVEVGEASLNFRGIFLEISGDVYSYWRGLLRYWSYRRSFSHRCTEISWKIHTHRTIIFWSYTRERYVHYDIMRKCRDMSLRHLNCHDMSLRYLITWHVSWHDRKLTEISGAVFWTIYRHTVEVWPEECTIQRRCVQATVQFSAAGWWEFSRKILHYSFWERYFSGNFWDESWWFKIQKNVGKGLEPYTL